MTFTDFEMIGTPRNRALYDLTVHALVYAKLVMLGPVLEIEEVAEELKGTLLVEQTQTK